MNPNRVQQIMKMSKASVHYMIRQSGMWRYLDSDSMDEIVQDTVCHTYFYDVNRGDPNGKFSWKIFRLQALQAIYRHLGWPDQYKKGQRLKYTQGKCELDVRLPDEAYRLPEPWIPIAKKRLAFHFQRLTKRQQDTLIDWFNDGVFPGNHLIQIRGKCNGTISTAWRGWYDRGQCRDGQKPDTVRMRKHRRAEERRMLRRKCQLRGNVPPGTRPMHSEVNHGQEEAQSGSP